jgi:hypothetical protein
MAVADEEAAGAAWPWRRRRRLARRLAVADEEAAGSAPSRGVGGGAATRMRKRSGELGLGLEKFWFLYEMMGWALSRLKLTG